MSRLASRFLSRPDVRLRIEAEARSYRHSALVLKRMLRVHPDRGRPITAVEAEKVREVRAILLDLADELDAELANSK